VYPTPHTHLSSHFTDEKTSSARLKVLCTPMFIAASFTKAET
jgi:hypothetical protein